MQFRVRSSSKKSSNNEISMIQFPASKPLLQSQSVLSKSAASRIDYLQVALTNFQQLYRRQKEINNTANLQIQKRLERVQFKTFSAEQDLRQLNEIKQLKPLRQPLAYNGGGEPSKNELIFLKQMIAQQKEAHKQSLKHQNTIIQQLNMKQLRVQQEFREMLSQQKLEYEHRMSGQGEEIREFEGIKQRKIDQQYQMIKGLISNSQKRILEQVQRKFKNQLLARDYIEDRLQSIKDEFLNEHKQTMATEAKFIRETKQSLQNLFGLINNIRKQLGDELAQTQKISVKNIQKLSMILDISKAKSTDEMKLIVSSQQDINSELAQLRNFITNKFEQNRQIMSQFEQQAIQKLENSGQFSKVSAQKTPFESEKFVLFQKEMNQWKAITQQKNLNVFKQISNTLKTMKLQWRKQNDELSVEIGAINESLKNMKKAAPNQMKKNVQAIITIFNNQFDVLADELETLTEMISAAKRQNEKYFKQQIGKQISDISQSWKVMMSQKMKESCVYTDKAIIKSQQSIKQHISKQIKYSSELLNQRLQKLQSDMNQLQLAYKKSSLLTTSQLEDYSLKIKTFNENYKDYLQQERKQDMKKRIQLEQLMRKNASNLMDICYKKSQFLVDGLKNNIEIAQMKEKVEAAQALDAAKDELKKQVQNSRHDMQKQFEVGLQKVTKQRQKSQDALRTSIQNSINTAKASIGNDITILRNETQTKVKQLMARSDQIEEDCEKDVLQLKNTLLNMLRDEKKLNQQNNQKSHKQFDQKISLVEKQERQRQQQLKDKMSADKKQIQNLIITTSGKQQAIQKEQINKVKILLQDKLNQQNKEFSDFNKKVESQNKAQNERINRIQQETKNRQSQIEKKLSTFTLETEIKTKALGDKIEDTNKKLSELKTSTETEHKKGLQGLGKNTQVIKNQVQAKNKSLNDKIQELNKISQQMKAKDIELQAKMASMNQQAEFKNKATNDKIEDTNKKLTDMKLSAEKENAKNQQQRLKASQLIKKENELKNAALTTKIQELTKINEQLKIKQNELQTKITNLSQQLDKKNKALSDQVQEANKKLNEMKVNSQSDKQKNEITHGKQVQSLKSQIQLKNKAINDKLEEINKTNQQLKVKDTQIQAKITKISSEMQTKNKQSLKTGEQKTKSIESLRIQIDQKNKIINEKLQQINKKLLQQSKVKAQKENMQKNQSLTKTEEIQKKIKDLSLAFEAKNKTTTQTIQQINKKIEDIVGKEKAKEGSTKNIGQESLNKVKLDIQKQIKQLSTKIQQVKQKVKSNDQQQAINGIKKSVNKLEAIVFSQQAKNKTLFDRITQDINKLSDHLSLIANQMRE